MFRLLQFSACVLITLLLLPQNSLAAPGSISFGSKQTLTFGSVTKQTGVDVTATVSNTSPSRGQIIIRDSKKNANDTINVTFQSCGLTADNVGVKDFTVKYGTQSWTVTGYGPFTQSGLPNPTNSGTALQYGATILVTKDAKIGNLLPCFNISAHYDCPGNAQTCTSVPSIVNADNASVTVIGSPMILNETQQMNFGRIIKPSINSKVTITPDGAIGVDSGNAVLLNGSSVLAGLFSLAAEKNVSINIQATPGTSAPGLVLSNFRTKFNNGAAVVIDSPVGFTTSATGTNSLQIGASLNLTASSVTAGNFTVGYNIIIDYQ